MERKISIFSCQQERITHGRPLFLKAFVLFFIFSFSVTNAQETVVDIFDLPAPQRCVSNDLRVVEASLEYDQCGPLCDEGEIIEYPLTLAIFNNTGSMRTSFAFYARLEQYNPDGTLANTYFISGCKGPVPPNTTTSLTFSESLVILDENGDPTSFDGIPYLCGGSLKLINLYQAWTDASDNDNRQCPLVAKDIAPKCDVLPSIEVQTPIGAFVEDVADVSCFGGSDGAIDISVSGGEAPYTFVWSKTGGGFSASTEDVSGLEAGTYSVTIRDAKNCPYTLEGIVVGEPEELEVSQGDISNVSCFEGADGAIDISVSGGTPPYTFSWTGPGEFSSSDEDLTGLAAGSYSVTVTDSKDCTDVLSGIIVGEPDELTATPTSVEGASCYGFADGSISITVEGGTPEYTFDWSGPGDFDADTKDTSGLAAGAYAVIVTDENGCTAEISEILVGQPDELDVTLGPVTDASCLGTPTGAIDIDVSGGTEPYTYLWSNGATTQDISGIGAGLYSVTVTDACDCEAVLENIEVKAPSALEAEAVTITEVSCFGFEDGAIDLEVSGGTSPYTFLWSNGETTEDISDLDAGIYSVTVTDAKGCEYTLSDIAVGEPEQVPSPQVQVGPADCFETSGSFSIVNAPAGFEYRLDDGDWFSYTGTITGVEPGEHSLVARNADHCESLPVLFDVPQPFDTPTAPILSAVQPDCESLQGTILVTSGTTGFSFSLNGADFVAYPVNGFENLAPGDYEVRIRSNDLCISEIALITLEEPICDDFEGCTLGYWKNHTDRWCDAFDTCTLYGAVFSNAPSKLAGLTLLEVLNLGGGGLNNLGRQSVAALLNACSNDVNFELATTAEVIAYVNANFGNAGPAGSYLDMLNNAGCPLGGSAATTAPSDGCSTASTSSSSSIDVSAGISLSPVPFRDHLNIKYEFDYNSDVTIQIFDLRGNLVKTQKERNAGFGRITSISTEFVRGEQMYIVKVITDRNSYTKHVVSGK